ncbi:MAG: hypothetical protein B7X78_09835, partial [Sphingomonadales bacterium 39-62-4]
VGSATALGVGKTIVGAATLAVSVVAGGAITGAGLVGRTTSCACTIAEESISMAEIAMVLRGDIGLKCVMPGKRDEVRFGFHVGDEAKVYWP